MNWAGKTSMALGLAMGLSSVAWAQTAAESELLSAQKAYQEVLRTTQTQHSSLGTKQGQLNTAKQRLTEIQNSISKLEAEVASAQAADTAAQQALQAAGARLDAAWTAVKSQ